MNEVRARLLQLLEEYGVRLHAMLTKITLRPDVAEDLLQELFLKLCDSDGYGRALRPEQYLFRSAIHLAFDWRRKNRRRAEPLSGQEVSPQASQLEATVLHEDLERVMHAVDQLSAADRDLITLRFIDGSSYETLAEQFRATPHQIRGRCSKAIGRLRQQLGCTQAKGDHQC